jgi:hypothetical protein
MRKFQERDSELRMWAGVFLVYIGLALVGFGGWDGLKTWMPGLFYLAGFIIFLGGLFLVCKDLCSLPASRLESTLTVQGDRLGRFHLNGYQFEAYERETDKGCRQFRLVSFPAIDPEREAAFIRYMVYEGLIEEMWPDMIDKIEREARWALFES